MKQGKIETYSLNTLGDDRGNLIAIEKGNNIPFDIKRVYYIFDTEPGTERGFHGHKELDQVAVCVRGSCTFTVDDGKDIQLEVDLSNPTQALLMSGMIWREMKDFSDDCVLVLFASDYYDEDDF